MKKLCILFSLVALMLSALTATAQLRFAAKAGLNLANVSSDDVENNKTLPTFLVGVQGELGLSENLGVGVGVQLSGKGFKVDEPGFEGSVNPLYLQIPVQLIYTNNGLFVGVGPYMGFGLAGKIEQNGDSEDLKFGSETGDDFSSTDFGGGIEVGYQFGRFRASASYNRGFANVVPKDTVDIFDAKINHSVIGLALAFLFGG